MRKLLDFNPAETPASLSFSRSPSYSVRLVSDVALQHVVFDGALVQLVGFLLLLFERVVQHVFALQGRRVLAANLARDLLHLALNLRVDFLQLIVQLRQLGIGGAELRTQIRGLNLQIGLLGAAELSSSCEPTAMPVRQLPDRPRWRRPHPDLRTQPAGIKPPCPCARFRRMVSCLLSSSSFVMVMFCFLVDAQDLVLFLIAHQLFLGGFDLHLQIDQLLAPASRKPASWIRNGP